MGFFDNIGKAAQKAAATSLKKWDGGSASPRQVSSGRRSSGGSFSKPAGPSANELKASLFWNSDKDKESTEELQQSQSAQYAKQTVPKTEARNAGGRSGQGYAQVAADNLAEQKSDAKAEYQSKRSANLGLNANEAAGNIERPIRELSDAEYNKLSDTERQLVDFNGLLTQAVESDKANQDRYEKVGGQARATYDVAVEEQFGKDRGSDIYAPETMALLQQLKIKPDDVSDLDDYLNLQIAGTADDLKYLGLKTEAENPRDKMQLAELKPEISGRAGYQAELANRTSALAQTLAKGNQMLSDFATSSALARGGTREKFGGVGPTEDLPLGFGSSELDDYFKQAFAELGTNPDAADETIKLLQEGLKPKEFDAFWQYADQRSRAAQQYGQPLGIEADVIEPGDTFISPKDFRKRLGLEG